MNLKLILKNLFLSVGLASACLVCTVRASTSELIFGWIAVFVFVFLTSNLACLHLIRKNIMNKDGRGIYRAPAPKRKRRHSHSDAEFEEYQLWKITRR